MSKLYEDNAGFTYELITSGSFEDMGSRITTNVIRLSPDAVQEYYNARREDHNGLDFDTHEEYMNYLKEKEIAWENFERKVLSFFGKVKGLDHKKGEVGATVTQNVSEIFTVVYMEKIGEVDDDL